MNEKNSESPLKKAIREVEKGNTLLALMLLEEVPQKERNPLHTSYLGLCLAMEHREMGKALDLCKTSVRQAPQDPFCYLNLGRVCLAAGHKRHAIKAFRQSLKCGCLPQVVSELQKLGIRKSPVLPFLPREHFFNRHLGQFFERLGVR